MKKNIKKQLKKKIIPTSSARKVVLVKAQKKTKVKSKIAQKNNPKAVLKQKSKKKSSRLISKASKNDSYILTYGDVAPGSGKLLLLVLAIIFAFSILVVQSINRSEEKYVQPNATKVETKRNVALEKEINDMVKGYPIEKMTTYISQQDPKVAAFLVAIAKKESAWGQRKPVLNGEDCYNYWGFRLKSDKMGSGGHTCFDSPKEAVEIVATRIKHLVYDEKIDTPKEMVIWKCGYGCDGPAAQGAEKWISDVDYYYKQMIN